jgi:hypothetical protein
VLPAGKDPARQVLLAHIAETYAGLGADEIAELRASLVSYEDQAVREMTTIWHEMGRSEGLEQGRAVGLRRSICRLLEAQFGSVPTHVMASLARITDEEELERRRARAIDRSREPGRVSGRIRPSPPEAVGSDPIPAGQPNPMP